MAEQKKGAEIFVECLKREGVEVIFGIPGGANLPIFDQLYNSTIRVILTRHEQGASHMADGYARSTGKPGVCLATSGPGATNLATGLATAHMDSIPVVAFTGQVATNLIGNDAFQEADATGLTRPITKHNFLVKDVRDLARTIREAFYIATAGRPGPVHVDIPVDIQRAVTEFCWPESVQIRSYRPTLDGHPLQLRKAAEAINQAKKPLLYVGGGAILSGAYEPLCRLAEKADIPVTTTLMANGAFPPDHPLYMGVLGMHGKYSSNMAIQRTDLLISCGARFDDRVTGKVSAFATKAKKIHFDIDPANISKTVRVDIPVVGDLKRCLAALVEWVDPNKHPAWIKEIHDMDHEKPLTYKKDEVLRPQYIIEALHEMTRGEAIISTGVGQHQMWAMQYYLCKHPRHFLTSGGLGTMGYGFPAAIGAKIGNPKQHVICIDGDGSFQMTMPELATAILENVKVIVAICNNYYLGMVRQWQELFYGERFSSSCMVAPGGNSAKGKEPNSKRVAYIPDFVKLAEAYGAKGIRVFKKDEVMPAIAAALKADTTVIIDFVIDPQEKVFPMVPAGGALDDIIVDMA